MRRRSKAQSGAPQAPSLDSFLDVVTNLVGILIILIMVVGITARDAIVQAAIGVTDPPPTTAPTLQPVTAPTTPAGPTLDEVNSLARDIESIQQQIDQVQKQAVFAFQERNQLQYILTAAEKAVEDKQQQLGATQQQKVQEQRELLAATKQLDSLYDQIESVSNYRPEVEKLAHYPTPLAKTVFGQEEHFRLQGGKISYVPMNQLVELLKEDAQSRVSQARNSGKAVGRIGPINGYTMEYTLMSQSFEFETAMGTASRGGVQLDGFVLIPDDNFAYDESIDQALQHGSLMNQFVNKMNRGRTTITIWTYPDSFDQFRRVRDYLYELGFTTAARPLPEDFPIGGSPNGQRSSGQ